MKLIVGLGNPGPQYTLTRHNIGFMAVDALAQEATSDFKKCSVSDAVVIKINIGGEKCVISKPMSYMNNSGIVVRAQMSKLGVLPEDLLIVYDDMALTFGQIRVRPEGSAGGHNGIKSIIEQLGTNQFARLRLGVGRPRPGVDAADYVLSNFTLAEKKLLPDFIQQTRQCVYSWVNHGVEEAMNQFNQRLNKRNQHE